VSHPSLTFDRFRALTWPLLGPERLELFLLLAPEVREAAWEDLLERINGERYGAPPRGEGTAK
jgi:hypothetical protein